MADHVIYLVRSWPRLSQTFIVNEVLGLQRRGVRLSIVSLVRSGEAVVQPEVAQVATTVTYLDGRSRSAWSGVRAHLTVARDAPARYLRSLVHCVAHPGLSTGYGELSTVQAFHLAVMVAGRQRRGEPDTRPGHVHAHFAHDPALVGLYVSRLLGLSFSFTGHARDLLQIPAASLARRARAASAVVTCCSVNASYITSVVAPALRPPVHVVHHGVELARFVPTRERDGTGTTLVSIGRLVEKKGFADLLDALRLLRETGTEFRCRVYGSGPLLDSLVARRDVLGLREQVRFMGAVDSADVVAALHAADAFVLCPRVTADGDRDGIPNVLVEAMACGLPVVSTRVGGIPELVVDDVNGLLVAPGDTSGVALALQRLVAEPQTRRRLGAAGRATVEADYDVDSAARTLQAIFGQASEEVPA